jgi:hypothetical protein
MADPTRLLIAALRADLNVDPFFTKFSFCQDVELAQLFPSAGRSRSFD